MLYITIETSNHLRLEMVSVSSVDPDASDYDEWDNNRFMLYVPKGTSAEGIRNTVANVLRNGGVTELTVR